MKNKAGLVWLALSAFVLTLLLFDLIGSWNLLLDAHDGPLVWRDLVFLAGVGLACIMQWRKAKRRA